MPLPAVVVDIAPPDSASEHVPVLLQACSDAVPDGECGAADDAAEPARALAIVDWSGRDFGVARIELGVRREGERRWVVRRLTFGPTDPLAERWKAVGLVIGTLVGIDQRDAGAREAGESSGATNRATAEGGVPSAPLPGAGAGSAGPAWAAELGALLAPALDDGTLRVGGIVGGMWFIRRSAGFVTVSAAYAVRPESARARMRWLSPAFGAGYELRFGAIAVVGRAEAFARWTVASASDAGKTERKALWAPGVRVTADGLWRASPTVGLFVGAAVEAVPRPVEVVVAGTEVGRARSVLPMARAGLRVEWP